MMEAPEIISGAFAWGNTMAPYKYNLYMEP